ncbi:hypothetical protein [Thalassomonas sp. RHCl1]|uniref:hypothetical protein n=1 Tax=Thalassomonas sp. RHCl1 TaxID=2995320 RepID=UPI00248B7795|nr:hypothetical protein [Thalassomonas sp. RHCl1]
MKKLTVLFIGLLSLVSTAQAAEVLCKNAHVDTITVEGNRDTSTNLISQSLLISFKNASTGAFDNCGGAFDRYVYLKADQVNTGVFNAMVSIAFMAKANNYEVEYMIKPTKDIYSATELAYLQIVENSALPVITP